MLENFASIPKRIIALTWDENNLQTNLITRIKISLNNIPNSLVKALSVISSTGRNIVDIKMIGRTHDIFEIAVDIEIKSASEINEILKLLRAESGVVMNAERFKQ
jgi:(p)ppGpp synthase/HD superfamily hydrolase